MPQIKCTQKPVNLIKTLIEWLTNPGDTVLDPFLGSGTTAIGCIRTGRRCIGIEKDAGYFEIAKRRIYSERTGEVIAIPKPEFEEQVLPRQMSLFEALPN